MSRGRGNELEKEKKEIFVKSPSLWLWRVANDADDADVDDDDDNNTKRYWICQPLVATSSLSIAYNVTKRELIWSLWANKSRCRLNQVDASVENGPRILAELSLIVHVDCTMGDEFS